jgi:hypothetical protein
MGCMEHRPRVVDELLTSSALVRSGLDDRHLRHAADRGRLTRVSRGVYLDTTRWGDLEPEDQHALRVNVLLRRSSARLVASHSAAAVVWGLPLLHRPPPEVHVIDPGRRTNSRSTTMVRHALPLHEDEHVARDGLAVTSPARTAVDLALAHGLHAGLMAYDHGLREGLFRRDDLERCLARRRRSPRRKIADLCLQLADEGSMTPIESVSAATLHLLGLPRPVRQEPFFDERGKIGEVDFWFPQFGGVGEADGDVKYTSVEKRGGRDPAQVAIDEKSREDRIRAVPRVRHFSRWGYAVALSPPRLEARLRSAGFPLP